MDNILIRCSSLHKVVKDGKRGKGLTNKQLQLLSDYEKRLKEGKKPLTEKQLATYKDLLVRKDYKPEYDISDGAKTYIAEKVKQFVYGFKAKQLDVPQTLKGNLNEDKNIQLYNNVFFTNYSKNQIRLSEGGITGEWDLSGKIETIDIKSAFTWDTFCALESELHDHCKKGGYYDQGVGYMYLNKTKVFKVAHCMSTTPDHLINIFEDDISRHIVSPDIPPEQCITVVKIEHNQDKEDNMLYRVAECQRYAKYYFNELINKNQ